MSIKEQKKKKKTIDEKIQEIEEKLRKAKIDKKNDIQKKGRKIWKKLKPLFLSNENILYDLLENEEFLQDIYDLLQKKLHEKYPEEFKEETKGEKENE